MEDKIVRLRAPGKIIKLALENAFSVAPNLAGKFP